MFISLMCEVRKNLNRQRTLYIFQMYRSYVRINLSSLDITLTFLRCPYLKSRINRTSIPHEIPPSLTPQNKLQTPHISLLQKNYSQVLFISFKTAVRIPDLSRIQISFKAIVETYQCRIIFLSSGKQNALQRLI